MNRISFAGALAAVGLLTAMIGGVAGAQILGQPSQPVDNPLSVKVGMLFPTSGTDSHNGGTPQFSAGLDYAIAKTSAENPSLPSVYFDYAGGSKNGGHINTYGFGVAIRSYGNVPDAKTKSGSPYLGAGIGAYEESAKNGTSNSVSKLNIGGKVFAGDEFSGGFFVEANYQILSGIGGVTPSGFGVQVGMRF